MTAAKTFSILKAIEAIAGGPAANSESYMSFVDSQAAFRVITSVWHKSGLLLECKDSGGYPR